MIKLLTISLILLSSLYAGSPTQSEQNSIYMEAILFVTVFGVMGIVSYIYSKKHAKEYKPPKKEVIEEKSTEVVTNVIENGQEAVGKTLKEAPAPQDIGHTLCAYALQKANIRSVPE